MSLPRGPCLPRGLGTEAPAVYFAARSFDKRGSEADRSTFNTLFEQTNYARYYRAIAASRAGEGAGTLFRLAGPLCDGGDVSAGDADSPYRMFPSATGVGDVIVFRDAVTCTLEMMSPYSARPTAAAFAVTAAGELSPIRRRDAAEDLVAHDLAG